MPFKMLRELLEYSGMLCDDLLWLGKYTWVVVCCQRMACFSSVSGAAQRPGLQQVVVVVIGAVDFRTISHCNHYYYTTFQRKVVQSSLYREIHKNNLLAKLHDGFLAICSIPGLRGGEERKIQTQAKLKKIS